MNSKASACRTDDEERKTKPPHDERRHLPFPVVVGIEYEGIDVNHSEDRNNRGGDYAQAEEQQCICAEVFEAGESLGLRYQSLHKAKHRNNAAAINCKKRFDSFRGVCVLARDLAGEKLATLYSQLLHIVQKTTGKHALTSSKNSDRITAHTRVRLDRSHNESHQ